MRGTSQNSSLNQRYNKKEGTFEFIFPQIYIQKNKTSQNSLTNQRYNQKRGTNFQLFYFVVDLYFNL